MAWTVLEDLALDAEADRAGLVARTSARRVAEHLEIQPGTAAKALQRLRAQGLVALTREPGPGGRFGLSVYQLVPVPGLVPTVQPGPRAVSPHVAERSVVGSHAASPHTVDADMDGLVPRPVSATAPAAMSAGRGASRAADTRTPAGPSHVGSARDGKRRPRQAAPVVRQQATLWDEPT
jgi:hypothetical protein